VDDADYRNAVASTQIVLQLFFDTIPGFIVPVAKNPPKMRDLRLWIHSTGTSNKIYVIFSPTPNSPRPSLFLGDALSTTICLPVLLPVIPPLTIRPEEPIR
jgi:hypothetical protein